MADKCITSEKQAEYAKACRKKGPVIGVAECYRARLKVCPPPDVQPVISAGADGINLLGVYQLCNPKPVELALYPPSKPMPNEAAAQVAYERTAAAAQRQLVTTLSLRSRAARARKIELGLGFWLGAGLCGAGAVALYLRR